jgi:hypothetical protein
MQDTTNDTTGPNEHGVNEWAPKPVAIKLARRRAALEKRQKTVALEASAYAPAEVGCLADGVDTRSLFAIVAHALGDCEDVSAFAFLRGGVEQLADDLALLHAVLANDDTVKEEIIEATVFRLRERARAISEIAQRMVEVEKLAKQSAAKGSQ